jgi:hypothetical protein
LYEKNLTRDELLDYVPPFYFYNFYLPSFYDRPTINNACKKLVLNEYLKSKNIRTPAIVLKIKGGSIYGTEGNIISFSAFINQLKNSGSELFFMKPDNGKGGKGICRIEKIGNELFINNEFLTRDIFREITGQKNYIIQEGVIQRSDINKIYPGSVNTLRVMTLNLDGNVSISAATLKMGRNGSFVDNASAGGISLKINTETGETNCYAIDLRRNIKFESHPNTGFPFNGFVIGEWPSLRNDILELARKTPEMPVLGWDIAIVEDGIVAIEFNIEYAIDIQGIVGGMRRKLLIDPYRLPKAISFS